MQYANTFNEVWLDTIRAVLVNGDSVEVRGRSTKELLGHTVSFPMAHTILTVEGRKLSYDFMFAEAFWIITGQNAVKPLLDFAPSYARFSDDGIRLAGAYGPKVIDQIMYVVDTLRNDPSSRQAVINIWRERPGPSKDIPCTLSVQFTVRDNKIHTFVNMRSNDVWLGMPYDVFTMTMLTMLVGIELNKLRKSEYGLGMMYHYAASRHLYSKDIESAKLILAQTNYHPPESPSPIELKRATSFFVDSHEFKGMLLSRIKPEKHHEFTPEIRTTFPWITYGLPNVG